MRALRLLAVATGTMALTACSPFDGFACAPVGYISTAHITMAEPRAGIELELCGGEGCAPGTVMSGETLPVRRAEPSDIIGPTAAPSPAPPTQTYLVALSGDSRTGWSADFLSGYPVLGYRLTDSSGAVIAEGEVDVDWVRVGGSEQCGGPTEATVELPG